MDSFMRMIDDHQSSFFTTSTKARQKNGFVMRDLLPESGGLNTPVVGGIIYSKWNLAVF